MQVFRVGAGHDIVRRRRAHGVYFFLGDRINSGANRASWRTHARGLSRHG
jgi:hypothetical protein